jgi:hypothetical protein
MNIPIDKLYHYIESVAEQIYRDRVIIYRFWPHGSKNINDLHNLRDLVIEGGLAEWIKKTIYPSIWCCDQEPLDHEYYRKNLRISDNSKIFRKPINLNYQHGIFEKSLLLHSEKRSQNLEQHLRDGELIGVYYWSHAIIARDWFRYAEHETFHKDSKKLFLIYNRAWSNTREYRLYFAELLVNQNLIDHCQTTCNSIDPELQMHYCEYTFKNPQWKPNKSLENYFVPNTAVASSSADFNVNDYNFTDIEVVLETLFDDNRIQLTEKILRPIACGHPFILASTQGSLEYIKSY